MDGGVILSSVRQCGTVTGRLQEKVACEQPAGCRQERGGLRCSIMHTGQGLRSPLSMSTWRAPPVAFHMGQLCDSTLYSPANWSKFQSTRSAVGTQNQWARAGSAVRCPPDRMRSASSNASKGHA